MDESAKLRKQEHENKTGGNWGEKGCLSHFLFPITPHPTPLFPDHALIFSRCLSLTLHPYYLRAWNRLIFKEITASYSQNRSSVPPKILLMN